MSELYMDRIDRILLQKYEEGHAKNCLEEIEKVIKNLESGRAVAESGRSVDLSPDNDFLDSCRR
jgi:hypothetical protein